MLTNAVGQQYTRRLKECLRGQARSYGGCWYWRMVDLAEDSGCWYREWLISPRTCRSALAREHGGPAMHAAADRMPSRASSLLPFLTPHPIRALNAISVGAIGGYDGREAAGLRHQCRLTHCIRRQAFLTFAVIPYRLCTNTPAEYVSLTVRSSPSVINTNSCSSMLVACFMR